MSKKTYTEYICEIKPQLREMAEYYSVLGLSEPVLWAESELNGEPAIAKAALIYALRQQITQADGHEWIQMLEQGNTSFENPAISQAAQEALKIITSAGIEPTTLTAVVRAIQSEVITNIASLLEYGPNINCIPLPAGREAHWQLFSTDEDGKAAAEITGLNGICNI